MDLEFVPNPFRSVEICGLAVSQNGFAIKYVPTGKFYPDMCELAIQQNSLAIRHVSIGHLGNTIYTELCRDAIIHNKNVATYIPTWVLENIVDNDMEMLNFIPEDLRSTRMLETYTRKMLNIPC